MSEAEKRSNIDRIEVIQGGMGAGVSNYKLAGEVSKIGEGKVLGVVSGVALNEIMVRRLQNGDLNGEVRWALEQFPDRETAKWIVNEYYIPNGKERSDRYHGCPFPKFELCGIDKKTVKINDKNLEKLIIAGNFCEITLAKKEHNNPIGINYLHKIQWPLLPSIYGAMLAGVDVVLIGAGFPTEIPEVFNTFSKSGDETKYGLFASMSVPVVNGEGYRLEFNPADSLNNWKASLEKPVLLGIVANHLGVKALPRVDGYVFENYIAGGHNAPAREKEPKSNGEPNYGVKDDMNEKLLESLLKKNAENRGQVQPYWYAGGYAKKLKEAQEKGARGIQVGSAFAFCQESAIDYKLKQRALQAIIDGASVYTSTRVSPSGFPFKVLQVPLTLSNELIVNTRNRGCDLGYLFEFCINEGHFTFRCPAETIGNYLRKGGSEEETVGRVCLCNGLIATIGLGSPDEYPIVTSGSDLTSVRELVEKHGIEYNVKNVLDYIFNKR